MKATPPPPVTASIPTESPQRHFHRFFRLCLTLALAASTAKAADGWINLDSGTTNPLSTVWGKDPAHLWVVGGYSTNSGRTLFHYSSSLQWNGSALLDTSSTLQGVGGVYPLKALWGSDEANVFTFGSNYFYPQERKWNGSTWVDLNFPLSGINQPRGIWGADQNHYWMVGGSIPFTPNPGPFPTPGPEVGGIAYWDGITWTDQSAGITPPLNGIWGAGLGNVWAVGDGGAIFKWNGSTWSSQPSGSSSKLTGVWGTDTSNVWVVGSGGTILKWNGSVWVPQSSGSTEDLYALGGYDTTHVWAVGNNGTILGWDGSVWTSQKWGSVALRSIWAYDSDNVWIVGDYGTIVRSLSTGWKILGALGWCYHDRDNWWWSAAYGWLYSSSIGSSYFYSNNLRSWLSSTTPTSTIWWSTAYQWVSASANFGPWMYSYAIRWILPGDYNGAVWSPSFGWVWPNGDGTYFYSASYGWLAATGWGAVWSYTYGNWL